MPELEDDDLTMLRTLDPSVSDQPPAPGSARYRDILHRAMSTSATAEPVAAGPARLARPARSWRWPLTWAAAVTAAAAAAVLTVVTVGGSGPAPDQMVLAAANTTADVTSLRGVTQVRAEDGRPRSATIEVSGENMSLVSRDGPVTVTSVIVGGRFYERASDDPKPRTGKVTPESSLAPFAESTGAVVRAALADAEVEDLGEEKVRGSEATHYRLEITTGARAALAALPAGQTAWFELENADEIASIDVWAAGNLIRRVTVDRGPAGSSSTEFYDFNQPITVTVPPGF
ncbi:hypothetical protein [Actinoplanes sp. NPDC089786]|uniref:hypothetical protein n=1 Tax=Actinoplanes sp. NPDC089786 TaxID=3155185 RepID=UPI003446989E